VSTAPDQAALANRYDVAHAPQHVAIIMDGNGRWARRRGLPRVAGHRAGADNVRTIVEACPNLGVKYLTLYTFSVENWKRPRAEVRALMALLGRVLRREAAELHAQGVRVGAIGRLHELPAPVQRILQEVMDLTRGNTTLRLTLALNYGGRAEITDACRQIARRVAAGETAPEEISEDTISRHLYAPDLPDPDLLIRTAGEMRVSNYLLWEIAYSEFWVTDTLWPDFHAPHLLEALVAYQGRVRKFGGLVEPG